jgi:hypothetical protein
MTINGTPSRAISTAWACRSRCGAKRRRTPAAPAARRSSAPAGRPLPSARRAVDDAQQRTDRQRAPHLKPGLELLPSPCVHADLATTPALAAADQHCAAAWIELALGQSQSLPDAQPGAPHDHDRSPKATAVRRVAGSPHDCDDRFDLRRIGRLTQALVGWSVTGVESRHRRRRSPSTPTAPASPRARRHLVARPRDHVPGPSRRPR